MEPDACDSIHCHGSWPAVRGEQLLAGTARGKQSWAHAAAAGRFPHPETELALEESAALRYALVRRPGRLRADSRLQAPNKVRVLGAAGSTSQAVLNSLRRPAAATCVRAACRWRVRRGAARRGAARRGGARATFPAFRTILLCHRFQLTSVRGRPPLASGRACAGGWTQLVAALSGMRRVPILNHNFDSTRRSHAPAPRSRGETAGPAGGAASGAPAAPARPLPGTAGRRANGWIPGSARSTPA
jgi:hypothetical protein